MSRIVIPFFILNSSKKIDGEPKNTKHGETLIAALQEVASPFNHFEITGEKYFSMYIIRVSRVTPINWCDEKNWPYIEILFYDNDSVTVRYQDEIDGWGCSKVMHVREMQAIIDHVTECAWKDIVSNSVA